MTRLTMNIPSTVLQGHLSIKIDEMSMDHGIVLGEMLLFIKYVSIFDQFGTELPSTDELHMFNTFLSQTEQCNAEYTESEGR